MQTCSCELHHNLSPAVPFLPPSSSSFSLPLPPLLLLSYLPSFPHSPPPPLLPAVLPPPSSSNIGNGCDSLPGSNLSLPGCAPAPGHVVGFYLPHLPHPHLQNAVEEASVAHVVEALEPCHSLAAAGAASMLFQQLHLEAHQFVRRRGKLTS
eukprot:582281-Hanusia_phi.AAC.2